MVLEEVVLHQVPIKLEAMVDQVVVDKMVLVVIKVDLLVEVEILPL